MVFLIDLLTYMSLIKEFFFKVLEIFIILIEQECQEAVVTGSWLGPYNRPDQCSRSSCTRPIYNTPFNKLPCFEDRHHWHWLDPIINSKSHVNLVLLSHLLQNLTSFENQLRCRLGVICEKLVKLSKAWNCQRSVWWKKIVSLNLLNNFHFS